MVAISSWKSEGPLETGRGAGLGGSTSWGPGATPISRGANGGKPRLGFVGGSPEDRLEALKQSDPRNLGLRTYGRGSRRKTVTNWSNDRTGPGDGTEEAPPF
eukprot:9165334-Pyramimonas_sp.AAC.1